MNLTPRIELIELKHGKPFADVLDELDAKYPRIEGRAYELKVSTTTYAKWRKMFPSKARARAAQIGASG